MNSAEVVVSAVVVEEAETEQLPGTYGDAVGGVHQPGGVQEPQGFLDSNTANSSGSTLSAVQKPGGLLDENLPNQAPSLLSALTEVGPGDPRAAALGIGLAARPMLDKGGRPRVLTPEIAEQLCLLVAIGFTRRQAAAYLGFSPSTITNAVARDPSLGEELARAEQMSDLQPELTVMAEAKRNWKAAAWYLEFKKRNPRPLSQEEKEARHQEVLEDNRRASEQCDAIVQDILNGPRQRETSNERRIVVKTRKKRR